MRVTEILLHDNWSLRPLNSGDHQNPLTSLVEMVGIARDYPAEYVDFAARRRTYQPPLGSYWTLSITGRWDPSWSC